MILPIPGRSNEISRIPPRPLMLIHCDTDDVIPIENMEAIIKSGSWDTKLGDPWL